MKYSIVMAYRNRKKLLLNSLHTIQLSSQVGELEVIIADDCSDEGERLEDIVNDYPFSIKLIRIEDKTYFNPCIPYNAAMKEAKGDIVVIQNPEIVYTCDILEDIGKRITDKVYLTYGVYSINKETTNKINLMGYDEILSIVKPFKDRGDVRVDGWFNHSVYRPAGFHFLTAITNENLKKLGYFDERFSSGVDYDDMEFITRIKRRFEVVFIDNLIAIHQYHDLIAYEYPDIETKRNKNKALYNELLK